MNASAESQPSALSDIDAALSGRRPRFVVNTEVMEHPRVRSWLVAPG